MVAFSDQMIFNKGAERCCWGWRRLFDFRFVVVCFFIRSKGVMRHDEFVVVEGFINIIFEAGWDLRGLNDG
jgi:hypothetical protein